MARFKKLKKLATGGYTSDDEAPVDNGLRIRGIGAAAKQAYLNSPDTTSGNLPIDMTDGKGSIPDTTNQYNFGNPGIGDTAYKPQTDNTPIVQSGMQFSKPGANYKQNYGAEAAAVVPYISNIVNTFRSPGAVPNPHLNAPINLQRVNYNNDRYQVESGARGMYQNADQTLDENTAQRVKQYTLAQRFNQLSTVNQRESNENVGITNNERQINSGITAGNNQKLDARDQEIVARQNAIQGQQSANLANASDKYIMQQNEGAKRDLDTKKLAVISDIYNKNGVAGRKWASLSAMRADPAGLRLLDNSKNTGQTEQDVFDAQDRDYQERKARDVKDILDTKRMGGMMKYSTGGMMKLASGGSIHIDPANKGKFTAWASSHGKSVQQAAGMVMANKGSYSPTIVKRANFAKNFAH